MKEYRFWEIDFLRGIAIILMIIFNYSFTLRFLNIQIMWNGWFFWSALPRLIASIFIILVGVSLTLSYSRAIKHFSGIELNKKYIFRGLRIFSYGILVTLGTWVFLKEGYIIFGILHFIGLSIILAYPLLRYGFGNLLIGLALIVLGAYLSNLTFPFYWLLWMGFTPENFYTIDYFPLLPWFGVVLIGVFFGNYFYPDGKRNFKLKDFSNYSIIKFLTFLGQRSLLIYLMHQPLLLAFLYLFIL